MTRAAPTFQPEWDAIERVLDRALELAPAEQDAFLRRTGSEDPALEAAARRLLDAGGRAGGFLEEPAASYARPLLAWALGGEPLEPGTMLGSYEIVRRLGRGATATVYLARDPKHRRSVAVKVLHPDLAAAVGAERFLREIEFAATLQHPHILPLFDSGRVPAPAGDDGLLYYVMPHVEGESLRQTLSSRGRLPLEPALRIAREIAGALDYSHRRGVVHRDIKPENILLQDGQAIVADFGIARALDAAGTGTEPTFGTGTPAYMSPEQSRSGEVDQRSDLYSLSCVVYEMLAGKAPFNGSPEEIRQRHLTEAPPPLPLALAPEPVARAVTRALAKSPADRFDTAGAFAEALQAGASRDRPRVRRRLWRAAAGAAAVAAVALAATELRSRGPLVLPEASRIAVLPFEPATTDTALARLGEDLAATVNVTLDRLGGITTVDRFATLARTAAATPGRSVEDALALGRRFGAGSVLTGTVARVGDDLRIEATLLRSDRPVPLARATVVAPAESLAVLTDSLTLQVVRQVWLRRAPPTPSLAAVTTQSVPALRAFLDGERAMLIGRWREAADEYRTAFVTDSNFTLAYARYLEAATWRRDAHVFDVDSAAQRHLRAGRLRLPERDRLLADSRIAPGTSARLDLLAEVTKRYPDYWPGWFYYGDALVHAGPLVGHSLAEAEVALRRALALNPKLASAWEHLGWLTAGSDTATHRKSLDQLIRLGFYSQREGDAAALRGARFLGAVSENAGEVPVTLRPLVDSIARDRSILPFEAFRWSVLYPLAYGFARAQIELDRRLSREQLSPQYRAEVLRSMALSWAARGAWDSALVYADRFVAEGTGPSAPSHAYSLTVLGAYLGAIDPEQAARRRNAAVTALPALPQDIREVRRQCLYWLDGVLAFVRHDRAGLAEARAALERLHTPAGDVNAAILSAFATALEGHEAEAGRRLAAIEWQSTDRSDLGDGSRYDLQITRMSAAKWLAESGRVDEAIRLLRAAESFGYAGKLADTYVAAGPAQLMLARLLEAQGDRAGALDAYRQFLRRVDLPGPAQRASVKEAETAVARLSLASAR